MIKLLLQFILLIILFRYLWRMIVKYWPKISDADRPRNSNPAKPVNKLKIDKSKIEDAEFTEIDE
ncbi:MAG: hypothetical protein JXQ65_08610 [Candidatus Marinimicrobia bacterium]|nr:hypothetical protein [Candidatus Neomarinimicrobiota bacterium]